MEMSKQFSVGYLFSRGTMICITYANNTRIILMSWYTTRIIDAVSPWIPADPLACSTMGDAGAIISHTHHYQDPELYQYKNTIIKTKNHTNTENIYVTAARCNRVCHSGGHYYGPLIRYVKLPVRMRWEYRERFPCHRWLSDPDMQHGTCVTHVPWRMPGSLTSSFLWSRRRGNVPGIPGACATRNFTYLVRGPLALKSGY